MTVQSATRRNDDLLLVIDGHRVTTGEKYTIIEMGYAVLLAEDPKSWSWLAQIGEVIPPDPDDGRGPVAGGDGWAVTSDPVVVALSYEDWWARNSEQFEPVDDLSIPTRAQAIAVVRNRRILNEFNAKYRGHLPLDRKD